MAQKKVKTRIQNKHDLEANWIIAGQNEFVPLKGEIIVYDREYDELGQPLLKPNTRDYHYDYARFKIGDGNTNINDLPFQSHSFPPLTIVENSEITPTYSTSESQVYLNNSVLTNPICINYCNFDTAPAGYTQTFYSELNGNLQYTIGFFSSNGNFDTSNLKVFVKPSQCLQDFWTLDNTVTDSTYNTSIVNAEDALYVNLTITLPSDHYLSEDPIDNGGIGRVVIKKLNANTVLIEPDIFLLTKED